MPGPALVPLAVFGMELARMLLRTYERQMSGQTVITEDEVDADWNAMRDRLRHQQGIRNAAIAAREAELRRIEEDDGA